MSTATPLTLSPAPSQCSLEDFVAHYGDVYEHSPWVAEAAWHQGLRPKHDNPDALAELMGLMLRQATPEQQIAVIRAHPDLAGKAALAGVNARLHQRAGRRRARPVLTRRICPL